MIHCRQPGKYSIDRLLCLVQRGPLGHEQPCGNYVALDGWKTDHLNFAGGDQADSENSVFDSDEFSTNIGISLSYNLFAGGLDSARYAEARSAAKEAKRQLSATEIQAAAEVREAVEALRPAQDDLRLQKRNAEFVQRNRDLVEKEYAAGKISQEEYEARKRQIQQASLLQR